MQTIGERLEEARKKKGISIREAAEATKIRGDYLTKFESNHFDIGLTEIYTRGFLRTYANFLKVPADRLLNDYAALGRGDIRPRQPSREVYGRMDITVASTGEAGDRAAPPSESASPEPSHANRGPRPRPGSSLPTGPDPAVIFRYLKWGGIGLVAIIAVTMVWNLFSGSKPAAPAAGTAPAAAGSSVAARGPVITLVALRPVRVTVQRKNADESYGETLFEGTVLPGEPKVVARPGALYITPNPNDALEIEINGRRHAMGLPPGYPTGQLPAP